VVRSKYHATGELAMENDQGSHPIRTGAIKNYQ
jgi:hypothetical protein